MDNVEEILKIVDEAKQRNYSDYILRYDLKRYLDKVEKDSYDDGFEAGYTECKEDKGWRNY